MLYGAQGNIGAYIVHAITLVAFIGSILPVPVVNLIRLAGSGESGDDVV
jgi:hypothetical protein